LKGTPVPIGALLATHVKVYGVEPPEPVALSEVVSPGQIVISGEIDVI
jgi:hypothetical protein